MLAHTYDNKTLTKLYDIFKVASIDSHFLAVELAGSYLDQQRDTSIQLSDISV
jgi:hypothetical protein